ncbi:MAG: hypothetical protein CL610_17345 [Anaerolineaceae bacterium]|nr:hypothetical protein [Anaerolineaceae bacterium]
MVSDIARHIDQIKAIIAPLDDDTFEMLKAGVAFYLSGVPNETDPGLITWAQDAMQMVREFPMDVTLYELAVVVEDEDRERNTRR